MKIIVPSVEDFLAEAPFEEVRLGVFSRGSSARVKDEALPLVVYEVFLTGAKVNKLFEYREYIGDEIAHFKDQVAQLHERAFDASKRITQQLKQAGITVKPGRIESL
ncbi:MAG: hypothetical protein QXX19_05370 [Candidatus Caldarchaeum sp.]